jgi:hypothetical protein
MAHSVTVGGRTFEVRKGEALVDFDVIDADEARDQARRYNVRAYVVEANGPGGGNPWMVAIGLPGDLESYVIDMGVGETLTPIHPLEVE